MLPLLLWIFQPRTNIYIYDFDPRMGQTKPYGNLISGIYMESTPFDATHFIHSIIASPC